VTVRPRLLALIGSGEMAPQMTRVQRELVRRLAGEDSRPATVRTAIIDTPYGFQENAAALSAAAIDYFGRRLGTNAVIAALRRAADDPIAHEAALQRVREADYVFSGPGSPTYALRHWSDAALAGLLADKLRKGGAVVAASAAALTLGRLTLPVYEIYKAGADPYWAPGLDVLAALGLQVAVLPHYDNREGSGYDTRFCWLGERRLVALEAHLPPEVSILGIDEHTALVVDCATGRASVHGRGRVTVRRDGRSVEFPAGANLDLDELIAATGGSAGSAAGAASPRAAAAPRSGPALAQRLLAVQQHAAALAAQADLVGPLVEELLALRGQARAKGDYATADAIRGRLVALGIEVADAADGKSSFSLPER
jgi:cyanophycinase-like exopeptidase